MNASNLAQAIPAHLAGEAPTLGDELDAAHEDMLTHMRVMLDHKAIYREELVHAAEARKRFFESCRKFNAAQARVASIAREAQSVSA